MDVRWLDLKLVAGALKRPTCRFGFGVLALGLSAFAWPFFPDIAARSAFASMFSLGVAVAGAWVGARIDRRTRPRRRNARYPR